MKLAARVHEPMTSAEACKAAQQAAIVASEAGKVEAEHRKDAACKHATDNGKQRRMAIRQKCKVRLAACNSNEAEELSEAQQTYDRCVLSLETKVEKATKAWEAAQSKVVEKKTQQEQICKSQEELVNQLMSVLASAERMHKV